MSEKMGRSLSDCLLSHRLMPAYEPPLLPGGGGSTSTLNLVKPGSDVTCRLATCVEGRGGSGSSIMWPVAGMAARCLAARALGGGCC